MDQRELKFCFWRICKDVLMTNEQRCNRGFAQHGLCPVYHSVVESEY